MVAGLLVAFAAACMRTSSAAPADLQQHALAGASAAFAAAGLSTAQLEAILRLPWQKMQVCNSSAPQCRCVVYSQW
jgi:hypothetical protein